MLAPGPEEVPGETKQHQSDGHQKIRELTRVRDRGVDRVTDNGCRSQDEDKGSERIAGNAVRKLLGPVGLTDGEDCRSSKSIENPTNEDGAVRQLREFADHGKHPGPDTQSQNRCGRCAVARMDLRKLPEKEIVVGHSEKDPRSGEHDAVRGTEGGDKNGARD